MSGLVSIKSLIRILIAWSLFAGCATLVHAGIVGSGHDFSGRGWGTNEICKFCHTPHSAKKDGGSTVYPLWNHTMSTATYTLYGSPTLKQTPQQPRGPSKLCLSCHDGLVAIDSYGNESGSQFIAGSVNFGTNLSDDHPISIYWDHQTVSSGPQSSCSNCHGSGGSLSYDLPFYDRYLECSTCHEPHNKYPTYSDGKMLRKELAGSAICLHCHDK